MSSISTEDTVSQVYAENIGGIDETEVELRSGVNILTGRNATNRTSFLQALRAALGSRNVTLKGDADEGEAVLQIGERRFTRELTRESGSIRFGGDPFTDDTTKADLFAFLLEDNASRRAVLTSADLRDVIMEPVDFAEIQEEIRMLEDERESIDERIEEHESEKERLPELEEERYEAESRLEEIAAELDEKRAELESIDEGMAESKERQEALDESMQALQSARSELDDVEYQIETERERISANREEREELVADLESLTDVSAASISELDSEIGRVRDHKQSIEASVSRIHRIIQFNEEMMKGANPKLRDALRRETDGSESVTDDLVTDIVVCWTCGSEVEQDRIEDTVSRLKELHRKQAEERSDLDAELRDLQEEKRRLNVNREERERLETRLSSIDADLASSEERIEVLSNRKGELEAEIESLEADIDELESEEQSELLDVQRTVNELEFEHRQLGDRISEIGEEIAAIEDTTAEIDDLRSERDSISDRLSTLRNRVEELEEQAVEEFNEHMQVILDLLEYTNLERIWIERTASNEGRGTSNVSKGEFLLHVIRKTAGGSVYEDTIAHLSESEREVVGLVFALAGYLVHDVHESMPFMLLDSLEAIDADRIATLVDYFKEYTDYLVIALLPEDADALPDPYHRVTQI